MATVEPGRMTHAHDGALVVFHIGMRVNRPWRPDLWLPVFRAMPRMLAELSADPGSGLLGYRLVLTPLAPWVVQWWNSLDKLYAYASQPDAEHRPAWTAFNRAARQAPRAVGIWHETYLVDRAESMYVGMPPSGLARATSVVPVGRHADRGAARQGVGASEAA
jgi:fumigallin biosynthesis monooxygenase-like protein